MRCGLPAGRKAREYLSKLHGCVAHPVLWREFNSLPAPHTRRAASFSIRFISKTGGAGWGSRGSPPLLGLRCPNFSKASWGSWGRLSEGVQCRPFIESKTDAIAQSLTEWAREGVSLPPFLTAECGLQRECRCKMVLPFPCGSWKSEAARCANI